MQLVSRITSNAIVQRLAVAATIAVLALTMFAVGRTLTSTSGEHGFATSERGGVTVLAGTGRTNRKSR